MKITKLNDYVHERSKIYKWYEWMRLVKEGKLMEKDLRSTFHDELALECPTEFNEKKNVNQNYGIGQILEFLLLRKKDVDNGQCFVTFVTL